jgi:ribosome biogenesis GTPase
MDPTDKDRLRERMTRGGNKEKTFEEKKRLRSLAKQRKASEPREKRGRGDRDLESEVAIEPIRRRTLDRGARPSAPARAIVDDTSRDLATALVVALAPGRARLRLAGEEVDVALGAALAAQQQSEIAVGDEVGVERTNGALFVRRIAPRRTRLSRPDPALPHRERVIAANVDVAVIVVSVAAPAFKPALIDRMIVAIEHGGVRPIVCVNKIDLLADESARQSLDESLAVHRDIGVEIVLTSVVRGDGIAELRALLRDRRCVFVGHSGVGKSSLLNALDPSHARRIGHVRESDGKGRHTTTASQLTEVWPGTEMIDTPGVREFGLWDVDRASLRAHFVDFLPFASACRFRDCSHLVEPDCGVQRAAAAGELSAARLAIYARLCATLG